MKQKFQLTVTSLLAIFFMSCHVTDDLLHGAISSTVFLASIPILSIWLYGTLTLTECKAGYAIPILGSLIGMVPPVVHWLEPSFVKSDGFFFVWNIMAVGITSTASLILSVKGLISLQNADS